MYDAPLTVPAILLALVLLVSGVAKLADRETSAQAFTSLRLPAVLLRLKAPQILPFAEIALALALVLLPGPLSIVATSAALALFVAYFVVIVRALGFDEPVTCSCFGKLGLGSVDRFTALRNLALVALAVIALTEAIRGPSVLDRLNDFDGADWAWLAGLLGAVVLTWLISGHRGPDEIRATPAVDEDGDYLRTPIPFVEVRTPQDQPITLRDMATREAVLLLIVSPTCGSCHDVITYARTWQHTVPTLRTCLVLPMAPTENVPMLDAPEDFDLLFDGSYTVARTFGVGNPSAVLLGADGKLAGGPVSGTKDVIDLMDDIAAELREASESAGTTPRAENPPETLESGAPVAPAVVESTAVAADPTSTGRDDTAFRAVDGPADGAVVGGIPQGDSGSELLDYIPVPTPFVMFETAAGASTSLRTIGAAGPAIFLYVSPGCGSCLQVMDRAPEWQEKLGDIPIHYVVTTSTQAEVIVERGVDADVVLVDEHLALWTMMGLATPSMFASGPQQELIAGPVTGYDAIAQAMEEIVVEVELARPRTAPGETTAHGGA